LITRIAVLATISNAYNQFYAIKKLHALASEIGFQLSILNSKCEVRITLWVIHCLFLETTDVNPRGGKSERIFLIFI